MNEIGSLRVKWELERVSETETATGRDSERQ